VAVQAKKRGSSTVRDMVISLAVVFAGIGVFVLLLPKSPHAKVNEVPYLPAAKSLARDSSLPILVPDPLPAGWQSNYVRVGPADALHIGFVLDAKRFARLDETANPDAAFYRDAHVPSDRASGTPAVSEQPPEGFEVRRDGGHVALVKSLRGGGVLVISDGGTASSASQSELVTLAKSLREQTG